MNDASPPANWGSRRSLVLALVVFGLSLAVYTLTLAPTVTLVDSGELILAARSLGVAHPPGFPLYVLLAHLATLMPIGNIAVRVNFASAVFAALAASVLTLAVLEIMSARQFSIGAPGAGRKDDRAEKGKKPATSQQLNHSGGQSPMAVAAACVVSGLLLAFSRTLWAYATIAEVYTLNSLLIVVIVLFMFRWRRQMIEAKSRTGDASVRQAQGKTSDSAKDHSEAAASSSPRLPARLRRDGSLYAAAFVFGLALGVHHVTVGLLALPVLPAIAALRGNFDVSFWFGLLLLPPLPVLVWKTEGIGFFRSRRLLYAAIFALAGLAIYSYLPIAASRGPVMNWGDPRTAERLWWHVTGRQYQVFLSFSLKTAASQFGDFISLAGREFGPWWVPVAPALAIAGMVTLFRTNRATFWFLALVIIADLAYSLGYEIAEDKDAYYLPVFIATSIAAGFGTKWLIDKVTSANHSTRAARSLIVALVFLVPLVAMAANLPYNNRAHYYIAHDYSENILSTIEPGGMLLTRDWQVYSPTLYVNEIEHQRNDAVVIDINQLRRSWYYDYLARTYPETIEQSRDKVDAFLEDLRHWEYDPDLYQRDLSLNQRINSRFFEMILAFVTNHIKSAPVYVTLDVAGNRDGPDSELTKSLAASYQFVPQGLVFQLLTSRVFQPPAEPKFNTRGLADGTLKFEDDDVVKLKVLPVYVTMFYNRGRYLAVNGHHEEAISSFKEALELDPGFMLAQKALNESLAALRKANGPKTQ